MCKEVVKQERGIRFRRGKQMEKAKVMRCERRRRHREDAEVEGNSKYLGNKAFIHRDFSPLHPSHFLIPPTLFSSYHVSCANQ